MKKEIEKFLKKHRINYTVQDDGTIYVGGDLYLGSLTR